MKTVYGLYIIRKIDGKNIVECLIWHESLRVCYKLKAAFIEEGYIMTVLPVNKSEKWFAQKRIEVIY